MSEYPNDFWKNKKILITGADGFLGTHVMRNLLEKRKVPKRNLFFPKAHILDLRTRDHCKLAVKDQDIILHLAAVTGNSEFHRLYPGRVFHDNIMMGVQLMEAARQEGIEKFIGIGSITAYPEKNVGPIKEEMLWQGYPEAVHAPYSFAKMMLLVQGQAYYQQYHFCSIHLLLTNLYGPGMQMRSGYVIPAVIKKINDAKRTKRKDIEVWGTGRETRDFLYVEDAAEGILRAAEKYTAQEPVNIASGKEISIRNLTLLLCRLMKFQGKILWDSSKVKSETKRRLDISRAKKEFCFYPQTCLEQGLRKTIQWHNDLL